MKAEAFNMNAQAFTPKPSSSLLDFHPPMRKVCPLWHFLQSPKSASPKARLLLWQVAQLCARFLGKCWKVAGEETCLDCGSPALTMWQSVQFKRWRGPCVAWLKLKPKARAFVEVR